MSLRIFRPSSLLAPYVGAFWDYEDLTGKESVSLSILPDTASYLCFLYQDALQTTHGSLTYSTRSGLAGFQSFRSDLGSSGKISGVSARLTPWGMNVFRQGVIRDCANRRVDCRDIFPRHSIEFLEEQLARRKSAELRVQCVEKFLLSVLNPHGEDRLVQAACKEISHAHGNCHISRLARHLGLSARTLERRFFNHIGASPKKFARVVRLRHAILLRQSLPSWAEAAYAAGYYDQSHMIHDCAELYGITPETLYPRIRASSTFSFSGLLNLRAVP